MRLREFQQFCCCGSREAANEDLKQLTLQYQRSRLRTTDNRIATEGALVLEALRTELVAQLPQICPGVVTERLEKRISSAVVEDYTLDSLCLKKMSLRPQDMKCELQVESGGSAPSSPWRGLGSRVDISLEAVGVDLEVAPVAFTYSTSTFHDGGNLLLKVSGLKVWVDATLDLSMEQCISNVRTVEVQIRNLKMHTEATAAIPCDLVLSTLQEKIKEDVEQGIRQVVRARFEEHLPHIVGCLGGVLRFMAVVQSLVGPPEEFGSDKASHLDPDEALEAKASLCEALGLVDLGQAEAQAILQALPMLVRDYRDLFVQFVEDEVVEGNHIGIEGIIAQLREQGAFDRLGSELAGSPGRVRLAGALRPDIKASGGEAVKNNCRTSATKGPRASGRQTSTPRARA